MPKEVINRVVKLCSLDREEVEKKWGKAKEIALSKTKEGTSSFYALAMGVFKRMIGSKCSSRLGWSKSEALLLSIHLFGSWKLFEEAESIDNEITNTMIQKLGDAISASDDKFFYWLFVDDFEKSKNFIGVDIVSDIVTKVLSLATVFGIEITDKRMNNLQDAVKTAYKRYLDKDANLQD